MAAAHAALETTAVFERRGAYDDAETNISTWAVRTLHAAYRDDRALVYAALAEDVREWEEWYRRRLALTALDPETVAARGRDGPSGCEGSSKGGGKSGSNSKGGGVKLGHIIDPRTYP